MIAHDLSSMVAVASGCRPQIGRWEEILKRSKIEYVVAERLDPPVTDPDYRVEVWVAREDAEEARIVLRNSDPKGNPAMW